jgi:DNA-binding FadR family transcriptional regulator
MIIEDRQMPSVRNRGISNSVLADIGERIIKGALPSGEAIGNESALMREHGVSRTALREAIRTLAGKGLLEARPRTGTRVLPQERWNLLDPDVLGWIFAEPFSPTLMRDLHEVRSIIEPAAAALAASRAKEDELSLMRDCCDRMDTAGDDVGAFTRADLEFHTTLLGATQNQFIRTFASGIQASLLAFFRATGQDPQAFASGRPRHRRLLEALQRRDPEAARAAALDVLNGASEIIEKLQPRSRKRTEKR